MGLLLGASVPCGDRSEQHLEPLNTEPAWEGCWRRLTKARDSEGKTTFHPWVEPYDTDTPQTWFGRDPNEWEGEAIQWVRWIGYLYRIGWRCSELKRGILL
jgi:hypothetical protein